MIRGAARVLLVGLSLAACSVTSPPPSPTGPAAVGFPEPGRPYDGDEILEAMRTSRRPGGVADELETMRVATQVADAIWTVDGRPWAVIAASGTCGLDECTLEVAGSRPDALGEDVWIFSVQPGAEGTVSLLDVSLGGVPEALADAADAVARRSEIGAELEGLVLGSATWLPPPDEGVLVLAYRTGDEEGSCRRDVRVDLASGRATIEESVDC